MMNYRMEHINPVLYVKDMARSLDFYCGILGFTRADWGDENFTGIAKDNRGLYLCKGGQGTPGTWVWMGFDGNIFELHAFLLSKDVPIRLAPTNFPWACEMQVEDPDGHVLRFGTDPDPGKPNADQT